MQALLLRRLLMSLIILIAAWALTQTLLTTQASSAPSTIVAER